LAANSVIGVDVGGTKILAAVVRRDGSVTEMRETPTPTGSQAAFLAGLEAAVEALLGVDVGIGAVGLGVPSRIDQRDGSAVESVNIPLSGVPLRARMAELFKRPVAVDNDANAAAIAEWAMGAGRGTRHMVMLTLGTGVGGGLILDGRPYRGAAGAGAELGHIVVDHDGPPCQGTCTGRGHLEALVSGGAADRIADSLLGVGARAPDLLQRAREGDAAASESVHAMGRCLGSGIATLVNAFEPELVVLGGGFAAAAGELLLRPAREVLEREGLVPGREEVRIELAQLGVAAGVVGAGLVAFEALDSLGAAEGIEE
jgi:glucokinase